MEVGWSELLVIGVVALVIIGPKDLPEMFRTLGRFTAKLRSMAREFSRAMEDAAKESGVQDVANDLRKVASPKSMGLDAVKSAADKFEKWDPLKTARGSTAATTAAVGGAVQPAAAAAAGLGSAVATEASPMGSPAGESAIPDPNAPAISEPAGPARGPHTTDLAMKRAEREAIAREAAARLRKTQPPAQSTASAFEDAPATVIAPAVTSTPLDAAKPEAAKPAAKRKPAAPKAETAKAETAKAEAKPAAKPATRKAADKTAAKPEAAKPAAKRRAPAKKTAQDKTGDQA
ncbi:Sec-independent protein translocase protein TatB [Pseudogemmobacter bohemicus]|uniref:Sec-independent protein translocase protein TatB n=1 Tax=Pseudogemmobacter bohemicus TaxID=2250708 RepID=UPI0018E502C1